MLAALLAACERGVRVLIVGDMLMSKAWFGGLPGVPGGEARRGPLYEQVMLSPVLCGFLWNLITRDCPTWFELPRVHASSLLHQAGGAGTKGD